MMNIVICGDSYYSLDHRFPGLHWREHLGDHNTYTLARGGDSNFLIWYQIQHAQHFDPDLILVTFTDENRKEFYKKPLKDNLMLGIDNQTSLEDKMWYFQNRSYEFIDHCGPSTNKFQFMKYLDLHITEFELLKNKIFVKSSLDYLEQSGIPYLFTFGGYKNQELDNLYTEKNVMLNGWDFFTENYDKIDVETHRKNDPWFHIDDKQWHLENAAIVRNYIKKISGK